VSKKEEEKTTAITTTPEVVHTDIVAYNPDDPVSLYLNPAVFAQLGKVATMMSDSELVPSHLRGKPADCFLVCSQAIRWKMDPFAAAQHIYVARGKVGWEGKIVAAIVNSKLPKGGKLNYSYTGTEDTPGRTVTVSGILPGEKTPRKVTGSIKDWSTGNEQWKSGDQMLSYRGAREWARRHMPEAVLGVYSDDEVQEIAQRESEETTGDALDELLNPASVRTADDPPEPGEVRSEKPAVPQKEEQKPSRAKAREKAKAKQASKKTDKAYKPGDVLPDGRTVKEVDEDGTPTIVSRKKSAPKQVAPEPTPEPEPEPKEEEPETKQGFTTPAQEATEEGDDEIDALFS
jgi:hypothetical protein